jgi:hypothetical protein
MTYHQTIKKAQEIHGFGIKWEDALEAAKIANRINKTKIVKSLIQQAGAFGISTDDLRKATGWDLHNLHSLLRKSFCEKNGIYYDYSRKRFFSYNITKEVVNL